MIDLNNSDIVIVLKSKDNKIFASQTQVYVKQKNEFKPIGLIQNLEINCSLDKIDARVKITFPSMIISDSLKKSVKENSALLIDKGCEIILK